MRDLARDDPSDALALRVWSVSSSADLLRRTFLGLRGDYGRLSACLSHAIESSWGARLLAIDTLFELRRRQVALDTAIGRVRQAVQEELSLADPEQRTEW